MAELDMVNLTVADKPLETYWHHSGVAKQIDYVFSCGGVTAVERSSHTTKAIYSGAGGVDHDPVILEVVFHCKPSKVDTSRRVAGYDRT